MLFVNINQYEKAKKALIESQGDIDAAYSVVKNDSDFKGLSEGQIISSLAELNEGLGEKILNFVSGTFGGDIAEIKTVLTQMKEQELKFNREEFEIYNQFYSLLQDQKALDRDKENANYQELNKDLAQSRNSLNTRMKELTKTHNEIFDALEEKIKGLVKDNNRKKRFFNAQRATDVLETKTDRYEKIKSITSKNAARSKDLEDFFGVNVDKVKKESENAKEKATKAVDTLTDTKSPTPAPRGSYIDEPEKSLDNELDGIRNAPGGFFSKRKSIESLQDKIEDIMSEDDFKDLPEQRKKAIHGLYMQSQNLFNELEREEKKVK